MTDVTPHSLEWFGIVDRLAPAFARTVRFTIQCESSPDVCSVCGDEPIGDFRVIEAVATTRGVPTIRLCDCCLAIRDGAGETLVPIQTETKRSRLASIWEMIYLPRRR